MADAMLSRERAWALVTEHVQSESLRKHLLAVEAAVRGYARAAGEDEDAWGFVALVHDFDYEKYPDRENHPYRGVEILKSLGTRSGSPARFCRTPTIRGSRVNRSSKRHCLRATN